MNKTPVVYFIFFLVAVASFVLRRFILVVLRIKCNSLKDCTNINVWLKSVKKVKGVDVL